MEHCLEGEIETKVFVLVFKMGEIIACLFTERMIQERGKK